MNKLKWKNEKMTRRNKSSNSNKTDLFTIQDTIYNSKYLHQRVKYKQLNNRKKRKNQCFLLLRERTSTGAASSSFFLLDIFSKLISLNDEMTMNSVAASSDKGSFPSLFINITGISEDLAAFASGNENKIFVL